MSAFSIDTVLTYKTFKSLIDMNFRVIINELTQYKNNIVLKEEIKDIIPNVISLSLTTQTVRQENTYSCLSLIHPRDCQPKIPKKDSSILIHANLKTMDDVFDIQSAINSILSKTEDIEYNLIQPYHKWSCEHFSEKYGYTNFYIIISLISEETEIPYYAIEVERTKGKKGVIYYILYKLKERLNIL
jgi:hypothetical protein